MAVLISILRVAGICLCLLSLAACRPPTPNAAAETPFVPTAAPITPSTADQGYPAATSGAPVATMTPGSYPAATQGLPAPTTTPESYPGTTLDPVFITYRDFEIVPAQNTARVGQQVYFLIESASGAFHQPYAGAAAPFTFEAPPNMGNGVSWPITFDTAQTLTILCGYHGDMTATLVIEP